MVHVWVALVMLILIGFAGLALDTGYGVLVGNQLQNAADAAALAAAGRVRSAPSGVRSTAAEFAGLNEAAKLGVWINPDADVIIGTFNYDTRAFSLGGRSPNAVQVTTRREAGVGDGAVPLLIAPVFGVDSHDVVRTATAAISGTGDPALLVLHPSNRCALTLAGTSFLTVRGGPIHVNSNNGNCATCISGNSVVEAAAINSMGQSCIANGAVVDALVNTGVPPLLDPLASLPNPPIGAPLGGVTVGIGDVTTLDPGNYSGGLTVRGHAILNPGIYVIGGSGLKINSGSALTADGVMLYIASGGVDISSGVAITLNPPDPSVHGFTGADTYAGIAIFQARSNTATANFSVSGEVGMTGTYYFPQAALNVTSNGGRAGARLIASELKFTGSGNIEIDFHGNNPFDSPPVLVK